MSPNLQFSFVLLAAGRSERMKSDKALLDFHGKPWIQHQVEQIRKSPFINQVYVVANTSNISLILSVLADQVEILENSKSDGDSFSSMVIGLAAAKKAEGVFVSPIDVPINCEIINQLAKASEGKGCKVLAPELFGKKGHPVLLLQGAVADLLAEDSGFQRLDFYMRSLKAADFLSVTVNDPQIHLNLNTPKAWDDFLRI